VVGFPARNVATHPIKPGLHVAPERNWRPVPRLQPTNRHLRSGERSQKTNSIPIDHGPAQFNAFYPQCSGTGRGHSLRIYRRSTADRILDVIVRDPSTDPIAIPSAPSLPSSLRPGSDPAILDSLEMAFTGRNRRSGLGLLVSRTRNASVSWVSMG